HRFLVRRPRGGAWFGGRRRDARPLSRVDLAQLLHSPPRLGCRAEVSSVSGNCFWLVGRYSGVHQHGRQHGRAAHQGPDSAFHELRPIKPHRRARMGRSVTACVSRSHARDAWVCDCPAPRCRDGGRMTRRPILIMAGGAGGHVFPALALARLLRAKSHEVVWLGTQRGLEARVVPAERIPIEWLSVGGLRGKGLTTLLAAPFRLALALTQALRVMWRHRPLVVV